MPAHTGQLGGINNRIKIIKRTAYGYRNYRNY
nr:transposase [Pseudomonas fluorescens]